MNESKDYVVVAADELAQILQENIACRKFIAESDKALGREKCAEAVFDVFPLDDAETALHALSFIRGNVARCCIVQGDLESGPLRTARSFTLVDVPCSSSVRVCIKERFNGRISPLPKQQEQEEEDIDEAVRLIIFGEER